MKTNLLRAMLLSFLLVFLLTIPAVADNTPIIRDDADLLTDSEEQELLAVMQEICEYGTPMFWTHRESGEAEQLAEDFYHAQIGTASGTLLAINMRSRIITVFSDGAIYRTINQSEANTITDNIYRYASAGNYYGCARSAFEQIGRLLRGERIARPMKMISNLLLAFTLALLIVYIYISKRYEQHTTTRKVKTVVPVSVLSAAAFSATILNKQQKLTRQLKTDLSSSSGSGGRSGGFGGGGGFSGGGGHSGGGGSHRF